MTETAQVIIIIVEGDNDADLLQQYVNELTDHSETQYHFEITRGDILGDNKRYSKAPNTIQKQIKAVMERQKFRKTDIKKVYQIVDIDGCFINQGDFLVTTSPHLIVSHQYDFNLTKVLCDSDEHKQQLKKSWTAKRHRLLELKGVSSIWNIPYTLAYFSVTSEHVLSGDVKYVQEDKLDVVEQFIEDYPTVALFTQFLNHNSLIDTTNEWQQLRESNGFLRMTNIDRVFQDNRTLVNQS
ncbi:hypothetical protein [Lactiplantibacillus paraplantarum]|uniref:hypothetical protein n=2 Tax=Lactobacillales TaxID=186826 RepID=UPI0020745574|nr:hypothetical protein [Lactiplantibacillus paraplantarum]